MDHAVRADDREDERDGGERPDQDSLKAAQRHGSSESPLDSDDAIRRHRRIERAHLGADRSRETAPDRSGS